MAEVIRMPRLSDTMEEGNIIGWLKKVGEKVSPGDVLAEVETDKATMELESFYEGVLLHIGVAEGPVPVDGILAVIGKEGEDYKAALAAEESSNGEQAEEKKEEKKEEKPKDKEEAEPAAKEEAVAATSSATTTSSDDRVKASPLAKNIAQDAGINIADVQGTGDNGRIIKKDVEAFIEGGGKPAASAPLAMPVATDFKYGDVPTSQMRKVIARRLSESKFGAPHFYLTMEIEMDKMMEARKAINDKSDTRISFNDIVVKAAAMALRKHPAINSSWHGDKITYHQDINIGVAVAVPDGLLVPVVNHADLKSLTMINGEVKDLAGKAKAKKLQPNEMTGNTFTISNLGMYPIDEFTAIINPPDACIMAVGTIVQKPIVKNNQIVVGHTMKVTLSCDHRVVDGATGSEFLVTFKGMLEEPLKLLV